VRDFSEGHLEKHALYIYYSCLAVIHNIPKRHRRIDALSFNVAGGGRLMLLATLMTVQCAFAVGGTIPVRADSPELVIDITKCDFGEVFAGEELEHTFLFRNAGTKQLELSQKSSLSKAIERQPRVIAATFNSNIQPSIRAAAMRAAPS
jgi:hypothetical protein